MEKYYSTNEIAEMLNISARTVNNMIKQGKIPAIAVGKLYRVSEKDLEKFIEDRRTKK